MNWNKETYLETKNFSVAKIIIHDNYFLNMSKDGKKLYEVGKILTVVDNNYDTCNN